MKSLVLAGSPRKGKNSDKLAELFASKRGTDVVYLRDLDIGFCSACGHCKEVKKGVCIKKDDMQALYAKARECDEIAIFSPVYWWQVTAQAKVFIDRLYALEHDEWKGKRLTVVVNGEAESSDKEYAILHDAFEEMAEYLDAELRFKGVATEENNQKDFEKASEDVLELV